MRFRTEEGRLWWRREAQHRNEVVGVPRFLEPHAANTPHRPHDDEEEGEPGRPLPTFIAEMRRSRRFGLRCSDGEDEQAEGGGGAESASVGCRHTSMIDRIGVLDEYGVYFTASCATTLRHPRPPHTQALTVDNPHPKP